MLSRVRATSAVLLCLAVLGLGGSALAAQPVALFEQGHGQRFVIEEQGDLHLSDLAQVFRDAGYQVRSSAGKLSAQTLAGVDVLVTSGLFVPYEPAELDAILAFVEHGGSLSVMLHIAPTYAALLRALGVITSPGVLNEGQNVLADKTLDFRVTSFLPHPLVEGIKQFSVYGGWAVMDSKPGVQTIAFTSRSSWIDADRNRQRGPREPLHSYGVLAAGTRGQGRFAVFGDDAIFQNRFLDADNRKLAANLVRWLLPKKSI